MNFLHKAKNSFSVSLKSILYILLFSCSSQTINAQLNSTLFFMHSVPESNLTNPAVQIPCKVFVGVPGLSSVHFNYANSYFSYRDVLIPEGDSLKIDFKHFNNISDKMEDIGAEFHLSLLNFGFIHKDYYFNFNLSDKIETGIVYPGNWFRFALHGNTPYVGKTIDLSGGGIYGAYYREWAFGASKRINNKLTIGAKAKLLFGKANITTQRSKISFFTGLPVYPATMTTDIGINASPLAVTIDENGVITNTSVPGSNNIAGFLLNSKNKGIALDFGFIWQKDENTTISGSIIDLGLIHWAYNPANIKNSGTVTYTGYNSRFQLSTFESSQATIDSFQAMFNTRSSVKAYYSFLTPKLYLGATYDLTDYINAGILTRNILFHNSLKSSFTASLNTWYSKYFAGSISWSYMNKSLLNIGGGLNVRTPHAGIYIISDNIYGAFKYKSARTLNIMFGLNMLFGCEKCGEKKEKTFASSCRVYRDSEKKKERFELWKKKMRKNSRKNYRN